MAKTGGGAAPAPPADICRPRGGRSTPRVAGPPSPTLRHAYEPSARSPTRLSATVSAPSSGRRGELSGNLPRARPTRSSCPVGAPVCRRCRRASRRCRRASRRRYSPRRPVHDSVNLPNACPSCASALPAPEHAPRRRSELGLVVRARARQVHASAGPGLLVTGRPSRRAPTRPPAAARLGRAPRVHLWRCTLGGAIRCIQARWALRRARCVPV